MSTDDVLRLNWLREPSSTAAGLRLLADKCRLYSGRILSEDDTRAVFVEPILRGLGWDTIDNDHVGRESRRQDPICDMQLLCDGKVAVAIETKPLDHDRILKRYLGQLEGDIMWRLILAEGGWNAEHRLEHNGKVFAYGVLTNGRRWLAYNFTTESAATADTPMRARALLGEDGFDLLSAEADVKILLKTLGREELVSICKRWKER
jgi:hypothetical protein